MKQQLVRKCDRLDRLKGPHQGILYSENTKSMGLRYKAKQSDAPWLYLVLAIGPNSTTYIQFILKLN